MDLFGKLGLTHVFYSVWFIGLLGTLAASVAVCSTRRFATVRRTSGYSRYRAFGSMLTHISILLILTGGVIRGIWGEKGYIEFREGETNAQVVTENGTKSLPFAIHLTKFEIETYDQVEAGARRDAQAGNNDGGDEVLVSWPEKNLRAILPVKVGVEQAFGEFKITVLKYLPDFVVDTQTHDAVSRSNEPRNPAILVAVNGPTYHNHRWLFAKFPEFDMHTKDTQSSFPSPLRMAVRKWQPGCAEDDADGADQILQEHAGIGRGRVSRRTPRHRSQQPVFVQGLYVLPIRLQPQGFVLHIVSSSERPWRQGRIRGVHAHDRRIVHRVLPQPVVRLAEESGMTLFVAGVSYKTAPVELREQLAVKPSQLVCQACRLKICGDLDEIVLLSTCNRVEITRQRRG